MAGQKRVTVYCNGRERVRACGKCRDMLWEEHLHLTLSDLNRIEVALRLRKEAAMDNGEKAGMKS